MDGWKDGEADQFASFFKHKVQNIVNNLVTNNNVFNGTQKIFAEENDFMIESEVILAMKSLKNQNCEGHDRIPLRILADRTQ